MLKRKEIIERLADKGYTKKSASLIVDDFVRVLTEALVEGEDIMLHGFGTFRVLNTKSREMIDYQSKEPISVPSHHAPKFTPGAQLKRWVREGVIRE